MQTLNFLNSHQFLAFFASASAAAVGVFVAFLNMRKTQQATMIKELKSDLKDLRPALFEKAAAVNAVCAQDPWAILTTERQATCAVLAALRPIAHCYPSTSAWHAVLHGAEFGVLAEFVKYASPLIVVLRHSALTVEDDTRPYNGDKARTAHSILRAVGLKLACRPRGR